IAPNISVELEAIVARALQSRPHDRYRSALAMLHALEALPSFRRAAPSTPTTPSADTQREGQLPPALRQPFRPTGKSQPLGDLAASVEWAVARTLGEPETQPAGREECAREELNVTLRSARTGPAAAPRVAWRRTSAPTSRGSTSRSLEHTTETSV